MHTSKLSRALFVSVVAGSSLALTPHVAANAYDRPEVARSATNFTVDAVSASTTPFVPVTSGPTTAVDNDWIANMATQLAGAPLTQTATTRTLTSSKTTTSTPANPTYDPYRAAATDFFTQGVGVKSTSSGTTQTYRLPANSTPPSISRSEDVWGLHGTTTPVKINRGDHYLASFVVTPNLGSEAMDDNGWNVIAQSHGPVGTPSNASWIEPEWALVVRNGAWRLVGGDYGRGNNWARTDLMPYQDGKPVSVAIDIVYGPNREGAIRLWLNGKLVAKETAINTMYADNWDGLRFRTGIYYGSQRGAVPTYARSVAVSDVLLTKI